MENREIERHLKSAVEKITPDVYSKIVDKCEEWITAPEEAADVYEMPAIPKKKSYRYIRQLAAAAVLILILGIAGGNYWLKADTIVSLDVNPSVSLELNRMERVVRAQALNEDGKAILGDMDLKGTDADVAVNALIGAMLKEGYLSEMENSVLLSVANDDSEKDRKLQKKLLDSVQQAFEGASVQGAVLSQSLSKEDEEVRQLAKKYEISQGKAALALQLQRQTVKLSMADIAALSINDINLLVSSKGYALSDVVSMGTASSKGYIGEERAEELAFEVSEMAREEVHHIKISMDYNEGRVTYEVEFYKEQNKYEYEFDAQTSELLEWESEWKNQELLEKELEELDRSQAVEGIGSQQALEIACADAGVSYKDIVFEEVTPVYENGTELYDIDFNTDEHEYEYKIDAATGEIIKYTHNVKPN